MAAAVDEVLFASQNVHRNVHAVIRSPVDNLGHLDREQW
jgi:hypothetical protein